MGCNYCRKNIKKISSQNIYDDLQPTVVDTIENIKNDNIEKDVEIDDFDYEKAKSLVKYLLNSDYEYFKSLLYEVMNLNNKEFKCLFYGDSDYDYNIRFEKKSRFKKLAIKFENFAILLSEWYLKDKKYHECLKELWRNFIDLFYINNLNESDLKEHLKCTNYQNWDIEIKVEFKNIIKNSSNLKEKFKEFLKEEFQDLEEVIKTMKKTEQTILKEQDNKEGNIFIIENLKSISNKILEQLLPLYFEHINSKNDNEKTKITSNMTQKLITTIATSYATGDLLNDLANPKNYINNLQNLIDHTNIRLNFKSFERIIDNNATAYGILGISFLNVCFSMFSTDTFLKESDVKIGKLRKRLENIKEKFERHKKQVTLIDLDDIDKAMKEIEKLRFLFEEDKDDIRRLVEDINIQMKELDIESTKKYLNLYSTGGMIVLNTVLGVYTRNYAYGISSIFNGVSIYNEYDAIQKIKSKIQELDSLLKEAKEEEKKILEEISLLNRKYKQLQFKIAPKGSIPFN